MKPLAISSMSTINLVLLLIWIVDLHWLNLESHRLIGNPVLFKNISLLTYLNSSPSLEVKILLFEKEIQSNSSTIFRNLLNKRVKIRPKRSAVLRKTFKEIPSNKNLDDRKKRYKVIGLDQLEKDELYHHALEKGLQVIGPDPLSDILSQDKYYANLITKSPLASSQLSFKDMRNPIESNPSKQSEKYREKFNIKSMPNDKSYKNPSFSYSNVMMGSRRSLPSYNSMMEKPLNIKKKMTDNINKAISSVYNLPTPNLSNKYNRNTYSRKRLWIPQSSAQQMPQASMEQTPQLSIQQMPQSLSLNSLSNPQQDDFLENRDPQEDRSMRSVNLEIVNRLSPMALESKQPTHLAYLSSSGINRLSLRNSKPLSYQSFNNLNPFPVDNENHKQSEFSSISNANPFYLRGRNPSFNGYPNPLLTGNSQYQDLRGLRSAKHKHPHKGYSYPSAYMRKKKKHKLTHKSKHNKRQNPSGLETALKIVPHIENKAVYGTQKLQNEIEDLRSSLQKYKQQQNPIYNHPAMR